MDFLDQIWRNYTQSLDTPSWALSLETSRYLARLIEERKPQSVLDLGAGFSSILFRALSIPTVHTVDTDPYWLEKVGCSGWTLEEFDSIPAQLYDLVLVDIDDSVRLQFIRNLHNYTRHTAVVDDMHRGKEQTAVISFLNHNPGWRLNPLPQTVDSSGRFAARLDKT